LYYATFFMAVQPCGDKNNIFPDVATIIVSRRLSVFYFIFNLSDIVIFYGYLKDEVDISTYLYKDNKIQGSPSKMIILMLSIIDSTYLHLFYSNFDILNFPDGILYLP